MIPARAGAALAVSAALAPLAPAGAVAASCPAIERPARDMFRQSAAMAGATTFTITLELGGPLDLVECRALPAETFGHVPPRPQASLVIARHDLHDLEIAVAAPCDAVLLVNDAAGHWHYDDDGAEGTDPRLAIARPLEGEIDVWVGSYDGNACLAELTLRLLERPIE